MKILHTGDWHIGNFPGPEKNGENVRFRDIVHCLEALDEAARQLKPDIIIVAGDIFHQARVWSDRGLKENQTAVRILRQLETTAPVVVMRGTPNHDSEEQFKALESTFSGDDNVHIVMEPQLLKIYTGRWGWAQIACIPGFDRGYYRANHPGLSKEEENEVFTKAVADLIIGLKAQAEPGIPAILVSHFTITGCNMESGQTAFLSQFEPVVYPDTLMAANYDLVCFGHIHRPQQLEGCENTFYCGAVSAINFNDEGQQRGFYLHEIHDKPVLDANVSGPVMGGGPVPIPGCTSTFYSLPTREYITIRLKDEDVEQIITGYEQFPAPETLPDVKDKIVRVLYDCTDEHNKAFNHASYERDLYAAGAFWVQEITPQKISITVDRRSMEADNTPEDNLREYLLEKGHTPETVVEMLNLARPIISEATEKATTERHTGTFVPVEIEVKNYRNYREETFSFEDVRFCTINGSNGVGKSSLFMDAMADALFEETREGELTGWICNDPEVRSGSIKFTFRLGDRLYRVTRTRQKSGKATLNIAEQVDGEWQDRSKEKFKDTQEEITNIIGMDSLTLKACALIMQDQYGLFLQADKEARMNILGSILGLGIYGDMEDIAADKASDTNREIRTLSEQVAIMTADLPDKEELADGIAIMERRRKGYEEQASQKAEELDSLKVKLNTQNEAAGRVIRINSKISTLTSQKASKETAKTGQVAAIMSANNILFEEPLIIDGVADYNRLLEREKELIKSKAEYESLVSRKRQIEDAIALSVNSADEMKKKKAAITLMQIGPLQQAIARAEELAEKHTQYEAITARIEEMEALRPEWESLNDAALEAVDAIVRINFEHERDKARFEDQISVLKGKVELLNNSGCPDAAKASCKFLADAISAKSELPVVEEAMAAEAEAYEDNRRMASDVARKAQEALEGSSYQPEEIEKLRGDQRVLAAAEREYNGLESQRKELALFEERALELAVAITEAEATTERGRATLAELEQRMLELSSDLGAYSAVQSQIEEARAWLEKEKQLPAARERKAAAEQRVLELDTEIDAIEKEIEAAREELDEEQSKTVGREELQLQVMQAEAEIHSLQEDARKASMMLGGLQHRAAQAEEKRKQAADIQQRVNELGVKAAAYEELKKAFSQDGIPHNVIRSIIPLFEATATNILGQMSQGRMSVEFVTEKVLKSNSKKEVTTLDIIINDCDTGRLAYMSRSGGERVKAALSVILALAEIKSSKAGIQLGFLFIDEPPFLDAPGVQAYCDALEAIQSRYTDLKVMAITHDPAMKSRFPQSVDVVKTPDGSKVIYE